MGSERTAAGFSGDVVLDAGAVIAFERGDERIRAIMRGASKLGVQIVIPATALAQAWRGGPRSAPVALLVHGCQVDRLDEEGAKEVGVRLGLRDVGDVADAQVVCCALRRRAAIVTSDPDDIGALLKPDERLTVFAV